MAYPPIDNPPKEIQGMLNPKKMDSTTSSRQDLRKQSSFLSDAGISYRNSLQNCDLYANKLQLFSLKEESKRNKSSKKEAKLQGLTEVLEHLLLPVNNDDDSSVKGCLKFDIAYEIFCAHQEGPVDETTFRDALLHPEYGLCIYIATVPISTGITTRFIVLKSPTFNSIEFLNEIEKLKVNFSEIVDNNKRLNIGRQETQSIINSMDTEWDKTCAKVLSAGNKSLEEIEALGFDPDTMSNSISRVREVTEGIENSFEAAKDTFKLRNSTMLTNLQEQISSIDTLIENKKNNWNEIRLKDLEDKKVTKIE